MSGTYRIIAIITGILLLTATVVWAGPAHVKKLRISREGSFTVVTIDGTGPMHTAHQSVEAKEGKPFRIVIDCLAARHNLLQKNFAELPNSIVTGIRTSQYAVTPEEVVRIVLELRDEPVYRVESVGNSVKVFVSDTKAGTFSAWSTSDKNAPEKKVVVQKPVIVASVASPKELAVIKPAQVIPKDTKKETQKRVPSVVKKKAVDKPVAKATNETVLADTKKSTKVRSSRKPVDLNETPIDSKPVPLQVKLGLVSNNKSKKSKRAKAVPSEKKQDSKATNKSVLAKKSEPIKKQPAPKNTVEKPVLAKAKTEQKKPSVTKQEPTKKAVPYVKKETVLAAKPKVTLDKKKVANDTIKRALAFAVVDNPVHNPPPPGDIPKSVNTKTKDIHKAASKQASGSAAKKQNEAPLLASIPDANKNASSAPGKPNKIGSLPVSKEENKSKVAAVTEAKSKPVTVASKKKPSRFRRSAAKSARLKQAQVVQFPQRIVIKYKGKTGRDPFTSLIDIDKKTSGSVDLTKIPNIETLHLVGVLESTQIGGKDAALLEDLDGIGYILKTGDRVRNGYVAQIDEQAIYFRINEYGWSRTIVKGLDKEK